MLSIFGAGKKKNKSASSKSSRNGQKRNTSKKSPSISLSKNLLGGLILDGDSNGRSDEGIDVGFY